MYVRLAQAIRDQLTLLSERYDARLSAVPGYADLPETNRRDLEQRVLQIIAECLEANDDSRLIEYVHARGEQVLARGFQPEWFQEAVAIPQDVIAPLVETIAECDFVWRSLGHARDAAWEIVARERRRIEQDLRESEARYQTIFDATPVMFWLKDAHNRTLRINRAAAEFEGVRPSDVEGKSAYELYPHAQAEAYFQDDLEVIRSNQPKLGIVEQHTSVGTGKAMWVETGKIPVHDEQGEPIGVLAFGVDVTDRMLAEEAWRHNVEQQQYASRHLRAALEAANELIRIQELDTMYRRAVELARDKFAVERCGLYLVDDSRRYLWGTYGTDDQRQTTDEHDSRRTVEEFSAILTTSPEQLWVIRETPHIFVKDGVEHEVGAGWVVATVLRGATGPIGILFNDNALSTQPVDEAQQEALAVYCSIIGPVIERKRLELQVQESLARRGAQVQTSTEVAQEIAAATDLNELFKRVVTLIKDRFDYYHAQLFRYDPGQDAVVLLTGYGEIGRRMLAAGHQLRMGRGVVGTAAATGKSILATDVQADADWRPNPNLPDTQGELAVPIKWRDQVLGILDVQSDQAGALTDEDRLLLEGLCGQIAIAMESKRLLDTIQQSEQLMRTLIDAIPDYIYAKDLQGRHLLGNTALAQLYGLASPAELLGKTDFDFYPRELAEQYQASEMPILRDGHSLMRHEEPNIDADGTQHWDSTTKVPLRNPDGKIIGLVGITSDITARKQAENDLLKFKLGLDRSSAAIFITDTQGVITYVNPAFEKVYGYTREEALGQTPRIIKSGLIPQEQYQHFWGSLLAGQTVAGELINRAKDGRLVPIQGSNSAIEDEQGNILGFLALHNDITEIKRAEQELARSAQLLDTIINNSRDLIYVKDTQSRFLVASQAVARLIGVTSPQELIGKNDYDFFPYELAHKYFSDEQKMLANGEALIDMEERSAYADGTPIWLLTSKVSYRAADGTLQGIVGIGRDITERKLAEQDLARFKQGLEQASDAVFMTDAHGRIVYVNSAFEKIYGYSSAEAIGQTPRILKSGQLSQEYYQAFWQALLNKQSVSGEKPNKTKDGRVIIVEDSNSPILDSSGTLIGFLSTHRDITERKQAEQRMAETLRETERLYAALDHESWQAYHQAGQQVEGYLYNQALIEPSDKIWEPEIGEALDQQALITTQSDQRAIAVAPLAVRGEIIGALGVYDDPARPLRPEDLELIEAVSEQVALALDSARLFDQNQRDAQREYTINRVTSRIRNARSVDEVLSIAAQELRLATRASRSIVEITPGNGQAN